MKAPDQWSSPLATPQLSSGEVHVWRASLPVDETVLQGLESTLTEAEKARAMRFIFERDQHRFVVARGVLRDLVGRYTGCAPETIDFVYGPHGKPAISTPHSRPAISFNLSHSHGLAVIAIGHGREVGIDTELIRPEFAGEDIAKRYFSAREIAELTGLPAELRAEGFFLCWTRKEAYIKAKGDGLHIPLNSFDVSLSPGRPATLSSSDEVRWKIESFVPSLALQPRHAAAVVAEGKYWTARYFEWNELNRKGLVEE